MRESPVFRRFPRLKFEEDFSFARHTTIGCGGRAAYALSPASAEEAAALLRCLKAEGIEFCFLGAGANVLPADGPFEGAVVRFSRLGTLFCEGETIYAGAGVTGGALCRFARAEGLSGFEPFTGIPMTVGGGVTMNAGVADRHFSDVVLRVLAAENGKLRLFSAAECGFSEKESIFQSGIAVLGVLLSGKKAPAAAIAENTARYRAARAHLPKGRSMGCAFVNPAGGSAGKLIDGCGLKGLRSGGARVSEEHANFILNEGGSAADVARVLETVKRTVFERTGVLLREEIRRLPNG